MSGGVVMGVRVSGGEGGGYTEFIYLFHYLPVLVTVRVIGGAFFVVMGLSTMDGL